MQKLLIGNGKVNIIFELFSISCAFAGSKSTKSFSPGDAKQQTKLRPKKRPSVTPQPQRSVSGWFDLKYLSRQHFLLDVLFSFTVLTSLFSLV